MPKYLLTWTLHPPARGLRPLLHPTFFCLLSEISHHQGAIAKASWGLETISRCKAYKVLAVAKNYFGAVMWPKKG